MKVFCFRLLLGFKTEEVGLFANFQRHILAR